MTTTYPHGTLLVDRDGNAYRARNTVELTDGSTGIQRFSKLDTGGSVSALDSEQLPTSVAVVWAPDAIKEKLIAAGVVYPSNWNEMGSSAKDLWEESAVKGLEARRPKV